MDPCERNLVHLRQVLAGADGAGAATGDRPNDLAGAVHDGPARAGRPARSYVLCCSPRCGSTLLAEGLHSTGRLGTPIEYLDPTSTMAMLWDRWRCSDLSDYAARLHRHRCSRDGVFGLKVHWFQIESLIQLAGGAHPVRGATALLELIAPRPVCVRLIRRDRARQGLSWTRALRSERWVDLGTGDQAPEPDVSEAELEASEARLAEEERCWTDVLEGLGVSVLEVAYEDLADDPQATVATVATWLGRRTRPEEVAPPRLRKQATAASEPLLDRYRRSHVV